MAASIQNRCHLCLVVRYYYLVPLTLKELNCYTINNLRTRVVLFSNEGRLTPQYIYPPALIQPSVVIPTPIQSLQSPYIDYNAATQAYTHYTTTAYEQYPYAASPATGYMGYGYPSAVQQPITGTATGAPPTAYIQYQPDRLQ